MMARLRSAPGIAPAGTASPRRRRSPAILIAAMLMAFLGVLAFQARPPGAESRLSTRYRLADLIEERQHSAVVLREEVERLRAEVDAERAAGTGLEGGAAQSAASIRDTTAIAGLSAVTGPGIEVTLTDSDLSASPSDGNVNDLVIHSQDVQAVVNAVWRAGAEAVAINGQRLVSTSAVLCVGNTLLLNGTVHSPPYVIVAVGATRERFDADRLVRRLKQDAEDFGLGFSVARQSKLELPAYRGSTKLTYARPVT